MRSSLSIVAPEVPAPVSTAPPLIVVAIDHRHYAYELLQREGAAFAVNILHQDQQELA